MNARAAAMLSLIEGSVVAMMWAWLGLIALACWLRIQFSALPGAPALSTLIAYGLLAAAPIAAGMLAYQAFAGGPRQATPRPSTRWRTITLAEARRHRLYGPGGVMVSLLVGLLLAMLLRAAEYLAALPALAEGMPAWLGTMQALMTLDVVLFTSLYAVALVAALKRMPVFPALLAAIWGADLAMQLAIADVLAAQPGLPASVGQALSRWIDGNVMKLLVGVAVWLPYLLSSQRVNLTYRHRVPATAR